jgi:fucose 4-O-acetylase-like acetyltransferase
MVVLALRSQRAVERLPEDEIAMPAPLTMEKPRNGFLDCLKAFAILTVVAGHTFQSGPDFEDYWPFKLVYAFHMPMFMFVSGMTASFFYEKELTFTTNFVGLSLDLGKKAQRLLIPFLTWAVVAYFMRAQGSFIAHLIKFVEVPDNGLWFLPVLFECNTMITAAFLPIIAFRRLTTGVALWENRWMQLGALVVGCAIVSRVFRSLPNAGGFDLARVYFPYFLAGLIYQIVFSRGFSSVFRPLPYLAFASLVPFWCRTEISTLVSYLPPSWGDPVTINSYYTMIVAMAGTLAFVDLSGVIYRRLPALFEMCLAFIGRRSLDVYAIHFYFLDKVPAVIAPTLWSLAISAVLRLNSMTALAFFGQFRYAGTKVAPSPIKVQTRQA